jgi:flagellar motor switch protein FliM
VINLCLPSVVLNKILRQVITETSRPRRRSPEMKLRIRDLAGDTSVGAVLQFPPVKLRARELSALEVGHVLRLPIPRHAAAELRVGGLALGRARAVRMGEHRGARMEPLMHDNPSSDAAQATN